MGRNEWNDAALRGVKWLVGSSGAESSWINVAAAKIGLLKGERNLALKAWPWKPGNAGWVEPTAHALVALKKASAKWPSADLSERVRMGEAELAGRAIARRRMELWEPRGAGRRFAFLSRNHGVGAGGLAGKERRGGAFDVANRMMRDTPSPLAQAWLRIAMRLHGMNPPDANVDVGKELGKARGI